MMANILIRTARRIVRRLGFDVVRHHRTPPLPALPVLPVDIDADADAVATIRHVQPYTLTSPERLYALIQAVRYVSATAIPGDIVECGVWRGGSMMAAALTLLERGDTSRHLHLFDTFEGMSVPGAKDVDLDGRPADQLLSVQDKNDPLSVWCYAPFAGVQAAMTGTGYPTT
jgi:O-methyltransferase